MMIAPCMHASVMALSVYLLCLWFHCYDNPGQIMLQLRRFFKQQHTM